MKRIVFLCVVVVLTASYAQAQISFGVRAGGGVTGLSSGGDGKVGLEFGGVVDGKLSDAFSVQPALLISTLGDKVSRGFLFETVSAKVNLTYIQVPVNVQYKKLLTEIEGFNISLILQAGPYFGYGISGKIKTEATISGKTSNTKESVKFGNGEGYHYKSLDCGLGLGAGVDFAEFMQINLGFNHGLVNISNAADAKNWSFMCSLIVFFGKANQLQQ